MTFDATDAQVVAKNRELYDGADGPIWRLAVYDAVHGGWEFANMGGRAVLDRLIRDTALEPACEVLELCCGMGVSCRYLVERTGCRVTGVDLNPKQIERAKAALAKQESSVEERIELVEADVRTWTTPRRFDLVYSIDSLMLIPELERVFVSVRQVLRPGGFLALAEITASESMDEKLRRFIWEVDGMISVPPLAGYRRLLEESGFEWIRDENLSASAVACFETIAETLEAHEAEVVEMEGPGALDGWMQVCEIYVRAFEEGQLSYRYMTCRNGSARAETF